LPGKISYYQSKDCLEIKTSCLCPLSGKRALQAGHNYRLLELLEMNNTGETKQEFINKNGEENLLESAVSSNDEAAENDSSLRALVHEEQALARERLRRELQREPTQEEIDRWLSAQTEGY
jgi:hypothetical protein